MEQTREGVDRASAREEFAAAVTEHSRGMFRAARSILDSDADAEDAYPGGLWEAVLSLPEEQRAAVTLYYYEDLPVAEVARVLGVAQGTVKSRLGRARQRLKERLREEDEA